MKDNKNRADLMGTAGTMGFPKPPDSMPCLNSINNCHFHFLFFYLVLTAKSIHLRRLSS